MLGSCLKIKCFCNKFCLTAYFDLRFCFLQHQLEDEAKKPPEEKPSMPEAASETKHQSIAQVLYAENRVCMSCSGVLYCIGA